jgi:ABC-type polysaccharide/polyol phosphate export permease
MMPLKITARNLFSKSLLKTAIHYHLLIITLVKRDIKARFKGSFLGFFWNILNPLLFMLVYSLVFSIYFKMGTPGYPVYFLSGFLPWLWFSEAIQGGTNSILIGSTYVKTAIMPSEILPIVAISTAFMNFLFSLPLLFIFAAVYRWEIGWSIVSLPIICIAQALLSIGIVLFTSTYNVFLRDLGYLIGHLLMILFFLNPICYEMSFIPEHIRPYYRYFPTAQLVEDYHAIFYYGKSPDWYGLASVIVFGLLLTWLGARVFKKHKDSFSEFL